MKNFLLICSVWFFGAFALASPLQVEVPKTSVIPKTVRATLPKNAKSEFFGRVPSDFAKGKTIWLHLYAVRSGRKAPKKAKSTFNPNDYFLDLWQRKTANSSFERLCSTKIDGSEFAISPLFEGQRFIHIELDAMWLRDRNQQTPIVKIKTVWGNSFDAGSYAVESIFVFTQGWSKSPLFQQFKSYNESFTSVIYSFDKIDERGILLVTHHIKTTKIQPPKLATVIM